MIWGKIQWLLVTIPINLNTFGMTLLGMLGVVLK